MIRCGVPRGSSTAKWLTAVNRSYSTSNPVSLQHHGASAANASARLTYNTNKIRSNTKTRHLPLSPFMNPIVVAAREKYKVRKLPPSKNPSIFQRELAKNPYALALATPVRMCQVLDVRLPSYFLQDFELMAHPETCEPWWVPTSLRKEYDDREPAPEKQDEDWSLEDERSDAKINSDDQYHLLPVQPSSPNDRPSTSLGPGVYTLSRKALLASMNNRHSGWPMGTWKNFLTGSAINSTIAKKVRDHSSWRTDMDNFVLELMRRRVVESLIYLVQRNRGFISGCVSWDDACMAKRQQGVILWTGGKKGGVPEEGFSEEEGEELVDGGEYGPQGMRRDGPPQFATLTIGRDRPRMVPVYNLRKLLGLERLAMLRNIKPLFEKEVLTVRNRRATLDLQMKLWRLQGYLSFPEILEKKNIRGKKLWTEKIISLGDQEQIETPDLAEDDDPKEQSHENEMAEEDQTQIEQDDEAEERRHPSEKTLSFMNSPSD